MMLTDDKYELFDSDGANLVGTFPTQEAALDIVRSSVEQYGESSMLTVGLGGEDESGELVLIAHGSELIRLAFDKANPYPSSIVTS